MNLPADPQPLVVEDLVVAFDSRDERPVLDEVSLTVEAGEMLTILGPSGCGKTTLLNAIAGLVTPRSGLIRLGDRDLFAAGRSVAVNARGLGMMFQSYALWPHMTVAQNVAFPLVGRLPKGEHAGAVDAALLLVDCSRLADRYPGEISGGQQQRVALARALVGNPTVVLFDEPLSNLDVALRHAVRAELSSLHRRLGFTGVYVTHDQGEGFHLAQQVVILDQGKVVQSGPPEAVYRSPATEQVARFLGANVVHGDVVPAADGDGGPPVLATAFGALPVAAGTPRGPGVAAVYPSRLRLVAPTDPGPDTTAEVTAVGFVGDGYEVVVEAGGRRLTLLDPSPTPPCIGAPARVTTDTEVHLLSSTTTRPGPVATTR